MVILPSSFYSDSIQNHWFPRFTESISSSSFAFRSVFFLIPRFSASSSIFFWAIPPLVSISNKNSFAFRLFCPLLSPLSRSSALMSYSPIHSKPVSLSRRNAMAVSYTHLDVYKRQKKRISRFLRLHFSLALKTVPIFINSSKITMEWCQVRFVIKNKSYIVLLLKITLLYGTYGCPGYGLSLIHIYRFFLRIL